MVFVRTARSPGNLKKFFSINTTSCLIVGKEREVVFMKKLGLLVAAVLILSLLVSILLTACSSDNSTKLKVVTSTSLMEYIVKQVGGSYVEVTNLVPPNQHPGNFDIKPGDIQNLAKANLLLLHGWPGEGYADKLVASANNPSLVVVKANINGNWMIPSVQQAAVEKVMSVLSEADSKNAAAYQKAAESYKKKIQSVETDITARLSAANVAAVSIIASARQADFLNWAGFKVVGSFNSPQELNPQKIKDLVDSGKAVGVMLVINNLQDGKDAGQAVAQELGVKNLNLSNFPGGFDNTETWEKAIGYNVDILVQALAK
jgi:ABC-type Zn uptake system ZnuABC Zn-binding protein ZnuA